MNDEPHVHQVRFEARPTYWSIHYGDQEDLADRPWHWPFESDEHYAKRAAKIAKKRIARLVRKHDRASRGARAGEFALPVFTDGKWGSEQLT